MAADTGEGKSVAPIVRHITQEKINLYAEASGDFNPIHVDETFAAGTPLGGTIAHGMLLLAYASEMMAQAFGRKWDSGGKLSARFKRPARPGDTATVTGKVDSIKEENGTWCASCSFECRNQNDEAIVVGEAVVALPESEE
ncbi:MAG: MaoC family dehydratase [Chloroflexi bacterium]|nr:MaoC family dehydratase [Chloroflexota bacterium]